MEEKVYPSKVLPVIKRMSIGDEVRFPSERTGSVRNMINSYKLENLKNFETQKIGSDLIVRRIIDRKRIME